MSKSSKGIKTAICGISSEEFCVNEMYKNGYSRYHMSKYQKMQRIARQQFNKKFTMTDYRRMFGFPLNKGVRLDEKDAQMLANWANTAL